MGSPEATNLLNQIDNYSTKTETASEQQAIDTQFVTERLGKEGLKELHNGILQYQLNYEALIEKNYPNEKIDETLINNHQFFRQKFVKFIEEKNASTEGKYQVDPNNDIRATDPEKATSSMKEFLGEEGLKLYQLALEEELNSKAYMNALFRASTTHFEGEKWAERPVVIVAGPSGCGKSYAAKAAVDKADEFLPKVEGDRSGNDVVAVDGGTVREVSQMRKLVIQAANNKGYTGIKDLHSQSKGLEEAKNRMQRAVLHPETKVGVVIPETFSDFMNPLNSKKNLLKKIIDLPKTKTIFCRVDSEDPSLFQQTVAFMGSRRAWKTLGFEKQIPLDLNNTEITESKAYGAGGFKFGRLGSYLAEQWYKKNTKVDLSIKITNDLVLKKPDPPQSQNWVNAKQGDPETIMVSKCIFKQWESYLESLPKEDKKNPPLKLPEFIEKSQSLSLIQTSGEMELAIAKEMLHERISALSEDLENAKGLDVTMVTKLETKLQRLKAIERSLGLIDPKTKKEIVSILKNQIKSNIEEMKKEGEDTEIFNSVVKALDTIDKEIQAPQAKDNNGEEFKQFKGKFRSQTLNISPSKDPDQKKEQGDNLGLSF